MSQAETIASGLFRAVDDYRKHQLEPSLLEIEKHSITLHEIAGELLAREH